MTLIIFRKRKKGCTNTNYSLFLFLFMGKIEIWIFWGVSFFFSCYIILAGRFQAVIQQATASP